MKGLLTAGLLLASALMPGLAVAAMHWAPAPVKHSHGGHDRSAGKAFILVEGAGSSASLINPLLEERKLSTTGGKVMVKPTGMGNYHALVAKRESSALSESAVRYVYMHGRPPGSSPSQLTSMEKSPLEIEPAPLAREHWRYYSGTQAHFIIRYEGKPLANASVSLLTANGTKSEFQADANGEVDIPLPEDFKDVKEGRRKNKPSEYVLQVSHTAAEQRFITTFSSDYHVNPSHWQSTLYGLVVVFGGMLLGWMIVRRKAKGEA